MIQFLSLSSGSSGNCYFFTDGKTTFLIDAGVGPRTCAKKLSEHGFSLGDVDFILVTHDHIDHIKALGIISSRYCKPVYTTAPLKDALMRNICTVGRLKGNIHTIEPDVPCEICGVKVTAFRVPHDATDAVGFHIVFGGRNITLITDCGEFSNSILQYATLADTLILESNYDDRMLEEGDYPSILKHRIKGGAGHLSNSKSAEALKSIYAERKGLLQQVFLCHLSDNNNTPALALEEARKALAESGASKDDVFLVNLPRGKASPLYFL